MRHRYFRFPVVLIWKLSQTFVHSSINPQHAVKKPIRLRLLLENRVRNMDFVANSTESENTEYYMKYLSARRGNVTSKS